MLTIGYSTRKSNPEYIETLKKTCGVRDVEVIEMVNDGLMSLSETYNKIIDKSSNNVVVLCHDDLEFDTKNWGLKLLKYFSKNPEFGIIGLAGSKYLPKSGKWWEIRETMYGIVNHKSDNKKWTSTYSKDINNKIEEVVLIDGLLMSFDKYKIKHKYDESVDGFHFYDLSFCIPNYLSNVKIGVVTDIRVTHLSVGMTNQTWEDNRQKFVKKYENDLPIDITNQNICETFIFCHDQDIILDYESNGKFNHLTKYKYIFLGNRDTNKVENNDKVIIAKNLSYNIEEYPNINSFTGWYALWKNNLITTPYVNLFEYDIVLNKQFDQIVSKFIYDKNKLLGYIPTQCSNYHFIDNKQWVEELFNSIKKVYRIDLERTIRQQMNKSPNMLWSSTSNTTMDVSFFKEYMTWFEPLFNEIKHSLTAGHAHERSITFFGLLKKEHVVILNNILKHYQLNSHGTQGHFVDFDSKIKELTVN